MSVNVGDVTDPGFPRACTRTVYNRVRSDLNLALFVTDNRVEYCKRVAGVVAVMV